MSSMPPWSHSTLTAYETCPRRYYLTKVTREIKEPQTEATTWGNEVHKALEERARDGKPLPVAIKNYEPLVNSITSMDGQKLVEERMAIDKNLKPTQWTKSWAIS